MTELRILTLAYDGALDLWAAAKEKADRFPDNEVLERIEESAWKEWEEIRKMILEAEQKEKK